MNLKSRRNPEFANEVSLLNIEKRHFARRKRLPHRAPSQKTGVAGRDELAKPLVGEKIAVSHPDSP